MKKLSLIFALCFFGMSMNSASADIIYTASAISNDIRDISTTGTQVSLSDDQYTSVALAFDFNFYDVIQNSVAISSNGFLDFGPTFNQGCCTGDPLPSPAIPNGIFAGLWEDLDSNGNTTGQIYYETRGTAAEREFIVGFYNMAHFPTGSLVNFEMILHETTNNLEVQFGNLAGDGGTHTIGIENYDGTEGLQYYRGSNIAQFSNTGILFAASAVNNVPAPATLALFGLGIAALGIRRKRRAA